MQLMQRLDQWNEYICMYVCSPTLGSGGWWVINATHWPLYSWERYPVPIVEEAGLAPGPVWTGAENLAST